MLLERAVGIAMRVQPFGDEGLEFAAGGCELAAGGGLAQEVIETDAWLQQIGDQRIGGGVAGVADGEAVRRVPERETALDHLDRLTEVRLQLGNPPVRLDLGRHVGADAAIAGEATLGVEDRPSAQTEPSPAEGGAVVDEIPERAMRFEILEM